MLGGLADRRDAGQQRERRQRRVRTIQQTQLALAVWRDVRCDDHARRGVDRERGGQRQRDLLPIILAAIKKDPPQKPEFAGLYDRLRVSAGMKQIFGTQAVSMGGFLVLYPIEDEKHVDDRRKEFGLSTMED